MQDSNIFKSSDTPTAVEEQLTGGCFSVPAAAITLLVVVIAAVGSFFDH